MGDRGRLFGGTLLATVALHCVAYEPGIEVPVAIHGTPPTASFLTIHGERASLERAVLHIDRLELRSCEGSTALRLGSVARAHGTFGDNGPWALDLAQGERLTETLRPAPGRYCELVLHASGLSFGSEPALQLTGQVEAVPRRETHAEPFDLVVTLAEPLELRSPGARGPIDLVIDQSRLFDDAGPLPLRLAAAAVDRSTR